MIEKNAKSQKTEQDRKDLLLCPHCGNVVEKHRNPFPTVDIIIEIEPGSNKSEDKKGECGIVLINRKNPPFGWAIPGGFVDYGESLENAAIREAREETSLKVELLCQLGAYSDPERDPRHHTISVVFVARATGSPKAADDAKDAGIFYRDSIPNPMVFDHKKILEDYFEKCPSKS